MKLKYFVSLLFLLLTINLFSQDKEKSKHTLPNILFIVVDDLKPLLHCYGESQMITPNFDRLAEMGTIFTNAHVQQAVCGPSRASVMTSTYPDRNKVWDLETNFRESSPDLISLPQYLKKVGYKTAAIGKIFHDSSSSPNHDSLSWSDKHFNQGKDYNPVYGIPPYAFWVNPQMIPVRDSLFTEAEKAGITSYQGKMDYAVKKFRPSCEAIEITDEAYPDGIFAREAINRLGEFKKNNDPFFLAVGFIKPHLPFNAPKKYWDLYKREDIMLAPFRDFGKNVPSISYKTLWEISAYTDIKGNIKLGEQLPEEKQKELIHGYMACVSYIDAQLGKILDEIEKLQINDNLIIMLWGDNGFHLGDHAQWCKHSNLEHATRVPLMLAGKGISISKKISEPVEALDIFPTLLDLSGINVPGQCQGISLLPLITGDSKRLKRDYAISQFHRAKNIMGYSIRTQRYRYTEWRKFDKEYKTSGIDQKYQIEGEELYDYLIDPLESNNFLNDPQYRNIYEELKLKLHDAIDEMNEK